EDRALAHQLLERRGVEVVRVVVGHEHQVGGGLHGVVGDVAPRVDLDDHLARLDPQRGVPEGVDDHLAQRAVEAQGLLRQRGRGHQQGPQQYRSQRSHRCLPPPKRHGARIGRTARCEPTGGTRGAGATLGGAASSGRCAARSTGTCTAGSWRAAPKEGPRMQELLVDFIASLDGYGEAEGWPGWWGVEAPEYLRWLDETEDRDALVLMGANTYRLMSGMSAQAVASEGGFSPEEEASLAGLAAVPKVVFSSTLEAPLPWPNTELVSGDAVEAVRAMKRDGDRPLRTL